VLPTDFSRIPELHSSRDARLAFRKAELGFAALRIASSAPAGNGAFNGKYGSIRQPAFQDTKAE
jgi:hypothetical protein